MRGALLKDRRIRWAAIVTLLVTVVDVGLMVRTAIAGDDENPLEGVNGSCTPVMGMSKWAAVSENYTPIELPENCDLEGVRVWIKEGEMGVFTDRGLATVSFASNPPVYTFGKLVGIPSHVEVYTVIETSCGDFYSDVFSTAASGDLHIAFPPPCH
jgi:hypothetical protein